MQRAGKEEEWPQVYLRRQKTQNVVVDARLFCEKKKKNSSILRSEIICVLLNFLKNYSIIFFCTRWTIPERQFVVTARTNIIFVSDIPLCSVVLQTGMLLPLAEVYMNITVYVATVSTHIGVIFRSLFSTK